MTSAQYIGRFAPSPTGLLHFGSLLAALASYCDARKHNGLWQLRIDDIDPPREMPDATARIEQTLQTYGFTWDGPTIKQSARTRTYLDQLEQLNRLQLLFPCDCSRSRLANQSVYPGYCNPVLAASAQTPTEAIALVKEKLLRGNKNHAIRVMIDTDIWFNDLIQGEQVFSDGQPGDTIVVRRDDLFAYALACAIDDSDGITHVVRGSDLLPTTASQLAIMKRLSLQPPTYAHIPVAVNSEQQKLSKQTHALALDTMPTLATLRKAWQFLGQSELNADNIDGFWREAIPAWQLPRVPKQSQRHTPL